MTLNELYEQIGEHLKEHPEHGELIMLETVDDDVVSEWGSRTCIETGEFNDKSLYLQCSEKPTHIWITGMY